ncbi:hypothetical protein ACLI4Y_02535 [Natrialbaceae archaeon A-CW3]
MVLKRLIGSSATRTLTVVSVVVEAKRALESGSRVRAMALLVVAALAWKWALIGLVAQSVLKAVRR